MELLGYAPAPGLGGVLVYLSVENLSGHALPVGESYLQSRRVSTREDLYSMGTGVTAACNGRAVRCGSFAAPLYGENAADASIFTLNLAAGRGALLHCFSSSSRDRAAASKPLLKMTVSPQRVSMYSSSGSGAWKYSSVGQVSVAE